MKKQYSKKQITEAIAYWKKRLYTLNESSDVKTFEVELGEAHYDIEQDETGDFDVDEDIAIQEVDAKNEKEAFKIAIDYAKECGWAGFKFKEATIEEIDD